jgi:hypothetical protein
MRLSPLNQSNCRALRMLAKFSRESNERAFSLSIRLAATKLCCYPAWRLDPEAIPASNRRDHLSQAATPLMALSPLVGVG